MNANLFLVWLPGATAIPPHPVVRAARLDRAHLGDVLDKRGKVVYKVATRFYTTQAALVEHGHSEVLFLNPAGRTVATYTVGRPTELPVALRGNVLYFRAYQQVINPAAPLPVWLCAAPNDCYHKQ